MAEHWAYVAWDGDHIGREVERAGLADNPDKLRQLSQRIEAGNEAWRGWALSHGGDVISMGGDEGNLRIPVDYLGELPQMRTRYGVAVGATVSVGVGARLSEAGKALMAAKLQGGDRIQLYEPGVEDVLAQAKPETEAEKIGKAYLQKADQPALNSPSAGGGMTGPSQAPPSGAASPESPGGQEKPADQGAAFGSPPPQQSADVHDVLGSAADAQGQKDQQDQQGAQQAAAQQQGAGDLKSQVLKILKTFAARKEQLEGLQQQDPELYQSITGLLKVLIAGARQLFGDNGPESQQDSAEKTDGVQKSELGKALPTPAESEDNLAHHRVLQDMLLEGRSLAGQPQQMAARTKLVGATGSEYLAPGEPGREVPVEPDPGFRPMDPARNPKTGQITITEAPGGDVGTLAAKSRSRKAAVANELALERQGMQRVRRETANPGTGERHQQSGDLGSRMRDVTEASMPLIPDYHDWRQGRGAGPHGSYLGMAGGPEGGSVHFDWEHVPEDSGVTRSYGPSSKPGTYVQVHEGPRDFWGRGGRLVGLYRYDTEKNQASPVPLDPNQGETWSDWGHTHDDRAVLAHIHQHLQNPSYEHPAPSLEAQFQADNAAATAAGRRGVRDVQMPLPTGNSLADMRARARAYGLIKTEDKTCRHFFGRKGKKCLRCGSEKTEKAALEAGTTGRHNVVLPVGSQIDAAPAGTRDVGQLKVQDQETGKTKWRSVRSGLVMDPQGQPVSSRNPGG